MSSLILHPASTFFLGLFLSLIALALILNSCAGPNESARLVRSYHRAISKAGSEGPLPGTAEESAAVERVCHFLKNIGDPSYLEKETEQTYAKEAFLDDTLVTHHGSEEIKKYFLQTAQTMTQFELKILDTARSGADHYIRWEMIFAAPKLAKGTPIHSIGMSQVRFNSQGLVTFHQDFWDSGKNIYGNIPLVGGLIHSIRKRMK